MKRMVIIQILILFLLSSCGINNSLSGVQKNENSPAKIIYHDFTAKLIQTNARIFEKKIDVVNGRIKEIPAQPGDFNNPIEVIFLDKAQKIILTTFIEHPLIAQYEFSSPEGELAKTTQILDSAQFFIRYNQNSNFKSVRFKSMPECQISINQVIKLAP